MFKDKDEELKRLEEALLQEEETPRPKRTKPVKAYNADRVELAPEELSQELLQPKKQTDILVLTAIALALIAGIFAVLSWWAVRFL